MANRMQQEKDTLNTVVGKGSVLEGSFQILDGIRVDGILRGKLTTKGSLVVGLSGRVEADPIQVKDAIVAGHVEGKLEAERLVKLESSAVVGGDIKAQVLIIEEGAVLRGFCDAGETSDIERSVETQVEVNEAVGFDLTGISGSG